MEKIELHLFHGFLGLPVDWEPFVNQFDLNNYDIIPHNLWNDLLGLSDLSFASWAHAKNNEINDRGDSKKIAVGYSLGGRLLMHLDTSLFDRIYLIAAHPGLKKPEDRRARQQADFFWSRKFLNLPWETLMKDWNSQEVFQNDQNRPRRRVTEFSKEILSETLVRFSLGRQWPQDDTLRDSETPIDWMVGGQDFKFQSLKPRMIHLLGEDHIIEIDRCGHGVIFDQPELVAKHILSGNKNG